MLNADADARIKSLVSSLGLSENEAREPDVEATFRPANLTLRAAQLPAARDIKPASMVSTEQIKSEFELRDVLGEGGMGVVRAAWQHSLGREVAVKSLRAEAQGHAALLTLEARLTGALAHPNIIPIHTLGRDEQGLPLLVMKRVLGVAWRKMLKEPGHPAWAAVLGDRFDWNLGVLMQIANAVEFAHSKRIVHRDLKPDNVMIGEYGEVYLVDWGIAVEVPETPDTEAPEFSDVIAGTPSYMAPEMVRGDTRSIGPRTDVYLLGAMLHELLTGEPPHTGNFHLTLLSALLSEPKVYGPEVPEGLAEIANKAMSANQGERYASASEFRSAILAFLRHRGSVQLAQEAGDSLRKLRMLLAVEHAGGTKVDVLAVYKLFGECRFGFQNALKAHEGNEPAREQLEVCLQLMAEYEVRRADPKAARLLLSEMRVRPAELVAQVQDLERETERQSTELSALRAQVREADPNVQLHSRANLATAVGLGFNAVFAVWSYPNGHGMGPVGMILFAAIFAVAVAFCTFLWRNSVLANKANRRLARTLLVTVLAVFVNRVAGFRSHAPLASTLAADLVLLGVAGGAIAVTIDRRFGVVSLFLGLAAMVVAGYPDQAFFLFSASTTVGLLTLVWLWRRPTKAPS